MEKIKRKIFGVITANVADIEQHEILSGIIENAQQRNIDIIVISNIYNPIETSSVLQKENCIYERLMSTALDALILISESIINADLQKIIMDYLSKRSDTSLIAIGAAQPNFELSNFRFINTSDENDIEDITDHLIEFHGFTDIDILSGYDYIEASQKRVCGYRRSLEKHGIPFDPSKVHFGDFWTNSGSALAKKYITAELSYPQALICCNDYMAYGLLDEFMQQNIPITEKMAVIGYEYIRERHAHTPLLATYQRSRKSLGKAAVDILADDSYNLFSPQKGRLIPGDTCGCHGKFSDIRSEMISLQTIETYEFLNLFSQFEHRLTECRNINEFVECCRNFRFMVRNVSKLYLCLYENWYDNSQNVENMVRYNLVFADTPIIFHKDNFSSFISGNAAPYYICPLFFANRELGYIVLGYDGADTFDHIFRNWLKSVSNGLELLRMKNDIRYLAACQDLSEQHESLTSMLNGRGLKTAYFSADKDDMYMVVLKICLFDTDFFTINTKEKIYAILDAAEAVRQFCGKNGICAKTQQDTFICLVKSKKPAAFLTRLLSSVLFRHDSYMKKFGIDSFVCTACLCNNMVYDDIASLSNNNIQNEIDAISVRRRDKFYPEMISLRNYIYQNPNSTFDTPSLHQKFNGSSGHLRNIYKKCFGISFHQDCICARVSKVIYFLTVTELNIGDIAYKCGYSDSKYMMRQFALETGLTTGEFRDCII
ncbi:MAG: substrate-binding domain-containing protein [Ruminococcus sp.]|jgi:DNA-binding LacI/PurR family transcriptional regulator/AraC-like DNA-binding protein|nr:substrate-binding domain-containing protein [Ruminococcus sp.]